MAESADGCGGVDTHEWALQGAMHDDDGRHCIIGALDVVVHDNASGQFCDAIDAIEKSVGVAMTGKFRSIAQWNDKPERTAAEVIAALQSAARS